MGTNDTATDEPRRCQNCGTALLGEHCYACGQPTKGLVRHFTSIVGDFLDSVFELDSRILRTVGPLLFRPGYLSNEYFAGRRVRYVSPVRLFVFTSLLAFFAAQFAFDIEEGSASIQAEAGGGAGFSIGGERLADAATVEEVERRRDAILAELDGSLAEIGENPAAIAARAGIEAARSGVEAEARRRIEQIRGGEASPQTPAQEPAAKPPGRPEIRFGGGAPWNKDTNPVRLGWLPAAANDWINRQIERGEKNISRVQEDPNLLKDAVLSALPSTLFILLPLFALLLKATYLFKRRLYMEHLIVALHSHAFLSMGLLLLVVASALEDWTAQPAFRWAEIALLVWMPLYLLLMQKRVYRQGWIMTVLKYGLIGMLYVSLLTTGVAFTVMASIVWL